MAHSLTVQYQISACNSISGPARYARLMRPPDPMVTFERKVEPVAWQKTRWGPRGRTEVVERVRVRKCGKTREVDVRATPVRITPDAAQIAAARREYLEWVIALSRLQVALSYAVLDRHEVTDELPLPNPWDAR